MWYISPPERVRKGRWQSGIPVLAIFTISFAMLLLSACEEAGILPDDIGQDDLVTIALTLTAWSEDQDNLSTPVDTPSPSDTPIVTGEPAPSETPPPVPTATFPPNNVTGMICFPGEFIPAMTAYFEETETELLTELPINENQTTYEVNLEPGIYIAYAWLPDFSRGGLYSKAVPCGLGADCTDHGLMPFTVEREQVTSGIDICDWFAGPFNVPYPPGKSESEITGNISGRLSYVTDIVPGLRVVAFNLNTKYWYWVSTLPTQDTYILPQLPAGVYHLVAYDAEGRAGGHADADHILIDVTVRAGETTSDININDWNAPAGAFPPDPTR